ncbi:MAG TPA: hypothetical protein VFH51_15210 [Myxococcota bacterium]|nr:hypothetical protein [Myxococcota bacterium]
MDSRSRIAAERYGLDRRGHPSAAHASAPSAADRWWGAERAAVAGADDAAVAAFGPRIERLLSLLDAGAPGVQRADLEHAVSALLWQRRGESLPPRDYDALFAKLRAPRPDGQVAGRRLYYWALAVLSETSGLKVQDALRPAAVGLLANTLAWIDEALAADLSSHRLRLTWLRASALRKLQYHLGNLETPARH